MPYRAASALPVVSAPITRAMKRCICSWRQRLQQYCPNTSTLLGDEILSNNIIDIVVAEDNAVLLGTLSEILKRCGYSVRTASDGSHALAEIRYRAPDILLSDLNMPGMSGFELLSIVRRRYPTIRVI